MSKDTNIAELLASLAPVRDLDLTKETESPRARALFADIVSLPAVAAPPALRRGRQRRRRPVARIVLPAAGLAAALTLAVIVLSTTRGTGPASAATALERVAAIARAQAPLALRPGQYLYTKSINTGMVMTADGPLASAGAYTVLVPHVREIWLGPDGGRLYETAGTPRFLTERDREHWIAAGRPDLNLVAETSPSENSLSPARPLDLPSNPDALYERLKHDAAGHGSGLASEMFTLVGDSLRETFATPAQRAALYEVAARIPGVEFVGRVTDPAGRGGIAVAFTNDGIRSTLIFDPQTSALLAEEEVALAGNRFGYSAGMQLGYAAYVTQAVVDSKSARP